MATYGYRRVSSEGQEDGSSLDTQLTKIKAMASLAGLGEPIMFTDVCSGSIPLDRRDAGAQLMAQVRRGDSVICYKLDRCFRDATDALTRADWFKQQGIELYLIDMGTDPVTQNGVSRMFFGMLALMAEFERTRIKERLAEGRESKRGKGGHIGGKRPFGFDVVGTGRDATLVLRDDEQEAIAKMRTLHAKGFSLRTIAAAIQDDGFTVSHMTVGQVLKRAKSA